MDKNREIAIKSTADNKFYLECFDDNICQNEISIEDAWRGMLGARYYGNINLAKFICELFQKGNNAGDMYDIMFDLARQCVQSLTPIQKETLLKAHAYGMEYNYSIVRCDERDVLLYHFAERIAYSFYDEGLTLHLYNDKKMNDIYREYSEIYKDIANEYTSVRYRGSLIPPYRK